MNRKMIAIVLFVFLAFTGSSTDQLSVAEAQPYQIITIKVDGSIDPPAVPITKIGNIYTLTGDIFGIINV